jgi:hypothetical protein
MGVCLSRRRERQTAGQIIETSPLKTPENNADGSHKEEEKKVDNGMRNHHYRTLFLPLVG